LPNIQPRRSAIGSTTAALLVVVVVLAASLAYVTITPRQVTHASTNTGTETVTQSSTTLQTETVTIIINQSNRTTISTTSCMILAPSIGVILRVVEDASHPTPVVGAQITGESVGWCNGAEQISMLQPATTNSSGWASLLDGGFGIYDLSINYSYVDYGVNVTDHYSLSISTQPTTVTCAVYNITSGNVTTTLRIQSSLPDGALACNFAMHEGSLRLRRGISLTRWAT
jgi:hypothetical protein